MIQLIGGQSRGGGTKAKGCLDRAAFLSAGLFSALPGRLLTNFTILTTDHQFGMY